MTKPSVRFSVGESVFDILLGPCKVKAIQKGDDRPLIIEYPDGDVRVFHGDGRMYKNHIQPKIVKDGSIVVVKEPVFAPEKGELIVVWNNKDRYVKQFDHMDEDGNYVVVNTMDTNGRIGYKTYSHAAPVAA